MFSCPNADAHLSIALVSRCCTPFDTILRLCALRMVSCSHIGNFLPTNRWNIPSNNSLIATMICLFGLLVRLIPSMLSSTYFEVRVASRYLLPTKQLPSSSAVYRCCVAFANNPKQCLVDAMRRSHRSCLCKQQIGSRIVFFGCWTDCLTVNQQKSSPVQFLASCYGLYCELCLGAIGIPLCFLDPIWISQLRPCRMYSMACW